MKNPASNIEHLLLQFKKNTIMIVTGHHHQKYCVIQRSCVFLWIKRTDAGVSHWQARRHHSRFFARDRALITWYKHKNINCLISGHSWSTQICLRDHLIFPVVRQDAKCICTTTTLLLTLFLDRVCVNVRTQSWSKYSALFLETKILVRSHDPVADPVEQPSPCRRLHC